ncbi:hypothetical protein [Streptomyces milbemycinicus]|uniref:hypothetical protein n=1 Tax=Streptomyces milbemycinicus TaxID=476552 RepID=UPI0033F4EE3B
MVEELESQVRQGSARITVSRIAYASGSARIFCAHAMVGPRSALTAQLLRHGAHVLVLELKRVSHRWARELPAVTYRAEWLDHRMQQAPLLPGDRLVICWTGSMISLRRKSSAEGGLRVRGLGGT